ncbi:MULTISPECIES: hypothetical protein, partial [unclassified Streptomyces]|uniref:hypothetical protein n=1 Tax=unclassified Streptomyces TaxID=2593676 RepID=UPI0029BEA6D5
MNLGLEHSSKHGKSPTSLLLTWFVQDKCQQSTTIHVPIGRPDLFQTDALLRNQFWVMPVRYPACMLGLIRFDGHSRSGAQPREDVHHGEHGEEETSPP